MGVKYSEDQKKVIDYRNRNILVSAAAGSGKTTVLVERVLQRIKNDGIDVDKMLILTFTNAAAAQMKERISQKILDEIKADPDNERLPKQTALVHNALITTIHSFCLYLINNNISAIDIDPSYSVADDAVVKLIESEVMEELIEECLQGGVVDNFDKLADRFVKKGMVESLADIINLVYEEILDVPFVEDELCALEKSYESSNLDEFMESTLGTALLKETKKLLAEAKMLTKRNIEKANEPGGVYTYISAFNDDIDVINGLEDKDKYDEIYNALNSIEFTRLPGKSGDASPEAKEEAKAVREQVKAIIADLKKLYILSPDMTEVSIKENNTINKALICTVREYYRRVQEEKKKKKIITFNDMEHLALSILLDKDTHEPSQIAKDYRIEFEEIMVDEYQDSNRVQEEIIKAICGEENGKHNLFMVGDVKQSIYSFRQACPDLFMEKYKTYTLEESINQRIDLKENYRSRAEVIDCVNDICEKLIRPDLGDIEYNQDARLNCKASYIETECDKKSKLKLLSIADNKKTDKVEAEALMVAEEIRKLVDGRYQLQAQDKVSKRDCKYGDIVILLRTATGVATTYKKILESKGIPAYVATGNGYFETTEIQILLNLLVVLDNPLQDIPMYGVMTSVFGGFSDEQIARIRLLHKDYLYNTIKKIAQNDLNCEDEAIKEASIKLVDMIDDIRERKVYTPMHLLLSEIIEKTDYLYYIASMPDGEQRRANVRMLLEKARRFEDGAFKGLYHFVRYINQLKKFEMDMGEAITLDENANLVKIMTIHKSKGLEFPICFVSGCAKGFNKMDATDECLYNNKLGMGFDYVEPKQNVKYKDIRRNFISQSKIDALIAEEMRVFYVAATRAMEKLIFTGVVTSEWDKLLANNKIDHETVKEYGYMPYYMRKKAKCMLDFITPCVDLEKGGKYLDVELIDLATLEAAEVAEKAGRTAKREFVENSVTQASQFEGQSDSSINKRINYRYEFNNIRNLYTKTSVSELKHAALKRRKIEDKDVVDAENVIFQSEIEREYIPAFAKKTKEKEITGTDRGSAYHKVMELFDFEMVDNIQNIDHASQREKVANIIASKVEQQKIDSEMADLIDIDKIVTFVDTNLAKRMCQARQRNDLFLEQPFVLGVSADHLDESFPAEELVLVQGIIDVFFIEDGEVVLMDYKTDRLEKEQEFVDRYKTQLDYYTEAIEKILGIKVKDVIIYSFNLGKEIQVN